MSTAQDKNNLTQSDSTPNKKKARTLEGTEVAEDPRQRTKNDVQLEITLYLKVSDDKLKEMKVKDAPTLLRQMMTETEADDAFDKAKDEINDFLGNEDFIQKISWNVRR